ncbi:helix-turn-helix domain-containing protein [Amycolatopsis sp. FDAARGOS 1241]|uniref:helix-turn-helix domain-containing protein n=1 Tax=Amycolatopsis sp. FDAARGOS 1241 TaxID=2778070 RepID=UPI00351C944B
MRIVDVVTVAHRALTITDVSRRAGRHVATTSRLVAELVEHGLLVRTPDGRVQIGIRMWELATGHHPRCRSEKPRCRSSKTCTTSSGTTCGSVCATAPRCCLIDQREREQHQAG